MTDRLHALTVHLKADIRDDDAQAIIQAIIMVKGVAKVDSHVVTSEDEFARERVRHEFREKLWDVLR